MIYFQYVLTYVSLKHAQIHNVAININLVFCGTEMSRCLAGKFKKKSVNYSLIIVIIEIHVPVYMNLRLNFDIILMYFKISNF